MIKVDVALEKILRSIRILPSDSVGLIASLDRVLAKDVYSGCSVPSQDNSAMDGFAIRASDTLGASSDNPLILEVIADVRAGYLANKKIKKNQAIRIMTGAGIPKGADSVIMVEDTALLEERKFAPAAVKKGVRTSGKEFIKVFKEMESGDNIRKKGESIKKGELMISKGALLNSAHLGLLASIGCANVSVTRKPKIAILTTGDELLGLNEKLKPGKIYSSNTYTLYSQVIKAGGIAKNLGIAKDKPGELEAKLRQGFDCDMIITSGGVSVGDYDFVKDVLAKIGTNMQFWKVAMRPGKPMAFGLLPVNISAKGAAGKKIPVLGLPGNPVSSMISFEVFARPAIRKMLGQEMEIDNEIAAVLEEDIKIKPGFRYFLRANTFWKGEEYFTRTTGPQGSGILKSMGLANSLIIVPEESGCLKKGQKARVRFLRS